MSKKKDEYLNISPWKFLYTLLFFLGTFIKVSEKTHSL